MRGDKVFQNVQALAEIGFDRQLDDMSRCIGHQAAHAGQLFDLLVGTAGAGVCHHKNIIVPVKVGQQRVCDLIIRRRPGLDHGLIPLRIRRQAVAVIPGELFNGLLSFGDNLFLGRRHSHIRNRHRDGADRRIFIADRFDIVEHLGRPRRTVDVDALVYDLLQLLLIDQKIDLRKQDIFRITPVNIPQILRNNLVEQHPAQRRLDRPGNPLSLDHALTPDIHHAVKGNDFVLIGQQRLIDTPKRFALAGIPRLIQRQVIDAENHILRRHSHRRAV